MSRPVFGQDRDPGVVQAMQEKHLRTHALKANPLIAVYGAGPAGAVCGNCMHLRANGGHSRTYYKCELRGITNGAGTDHRVRWPACGQYEPPPPPVTE